MHHRTNPAPTRGKANARSNLAWTGAEEKSYTQLMGALLRTKPAMETVKQGQQQQQGGGVAGVGGVSGWIGRIHVECYDISFHRLKLIVCSSPYRATRNWTNRVVLSKNKQNKKNIIRWIMISYRILHSLHLRTSSFINLLVFLLKPLRLGGYRLLCWVLYFAVTVICYDSCHAQLLAVTIRVIWLVGFSVEVVLPCLVQ